MIRLGGLGHVALKLARPIGTQVMLLTPSPDKERDTRRLGADHMPRNHGGLSR